MLSHAVTITTGDYFGVLIVVVIFVAVVVVVIINVVIVVVFGQAIEGIQTSIGRVEICIMIWTIMN